MDTTSTLAPRSERRRFPRLVCRLPIVIERDGVVAPVDCEAVDVSAGGVRVEALSRIPTGPCRISLDPLSPGGLSLVGRVLDETIDVESGVVTARVAFSVDPETARDRLQALTGLVVPVAEHARRGRRRALVLAGLAVLVVAGAVGVGLGTGNGTRTRTDLGALDGDRPAAARPVPAAVTESIEDGETTPTTVAPTVEPSAPSSAGATSDATTVDASSGATASTGASPPTATRVEHADSSVHVHLAENPDDTTVTSSVGPSSGVDDVRVHLDVLLPQRGMTLSVAVIVENRSSEALTFPDGVTAVVTALRDGEAVTTAVVGSEITELAAGEVVSVDGLIDLGSPGDYDFAIDIEVTRTAEGSEDVEGDSSTGA